MSRTGPRGFDANRPWTYALLGGGLSMPFTLVGYWATGSELSLSPVLFGGMLAGYLAGRGDGESRGVGLRAGVVGGLPILVALGDVVRAASGLAGPSWFVVGGTGLAVGSAVAAGLLAFGLSALLGEVGARVGGWLANASSGSRPPPATGR